MDEPINQSIEELREAATLVRDVSQHASKISCSVQNLLSRMKNGEFDTTKGISFLNAKSHMLLNYMTNMTYIIMRKMSGKQIEGDPAIERLVELRTVLEKMRPIDQKLRYQIGKLITVANTGNVNANDPLYLRANPSNFVTQHNQESDTSDSEEEEKEKDDVKLNKQKVYVPPKISATYYDGDETEKSKQEKWLEKAKKRALSSSILEELRKEYDTGPEEIKDGVDFHEKKLNDEMKDRIRYEEEYMLRLPMTKKQRHDVRRVTTVSSLHNLAKFDDISALELEPDNMPVKKKRTSKKFSAKKAKGKKKGFRKKKH